MGLFDNILSADESLIIDETPLDFDFVPKLIKYRTKEQFSVANSIKPLFNNRNGRNVLAFGPPGVGKSVAIKNVLKELESETDKINIFYINCWQFNTSFKIVTEISEQFGYHFTQNKKTIEIFKILEQKLNSQANVFVFDEIDKVNDTDFIYFLLEKIFKKSIILITNYPSWIEDLDKRINSRLMPEIIEFKPYNKQEIKGILQERLDHAFRLGVWEDLAFEKVIEKTNEINDLRAGLFLLKEAGLSAEQKSSRKILVEHVNKAILKLDDFSIKKSDNLDDETKKILKLIKKSSASKIGDLFKKYQDQGNLISYKTFQRKITKLNEGKFIVIKKQIGKGGNTTIIEQLKFN